MARSRSSFELTNAIATASTLAREEKKPAAPVPDLAAYDAKGLVSFQAVEAPASAAAPAPPAPPVNEAAPPSRPEPAAPPAKGGTSLAIPPPPPSAASSEPAATGPQPAPSQGAQRPPSVDDIGDGKRGPPRLPDLSNVVSPIVRCEKIVEWIAEATGGSGVFMADADGLPVAGDIQDAEALIGASGLVASSIATLLQALPGEPSPLFEVHIGEGPYFQLIGLRAANGTYVVGLWRQAPLSPRQANAIRLACRHAFGESLGGAAGSKS